MINLRKRIDLQMFSKFTVFLSDPPSVICNNTRSFSGLKLLKNNLRKCAIKCVKIDFRSQKKKIKIEKII